MNYCLRCPRGRKGGIFHTADEIFMTQQMLKAKLSLRETNWSHLSVSAGRKTHKRGTDQKGLMCRAANVLMTKVTIKRWKAMKIRKVQLWTRTGLNVVQLSLSFPFCTPICIHHWGSCSQNCPQWKTLLLLGHGPLLLGNKDKRDESEINLR